MTTADIIELPIEPTDPTVATDPAVETVEAEQLSLGLTTADGRPLRPSRVHTRFRLDADTRQRGLRHVAEIRARLADGAARPTIESTTDADVVAFPARARVGRQAS